MRRRIGENLLPECIEQTVKFGGRSAMVWVQLQRWKEYKSGRKKDYIKILSRHLLPYMQSMGSSYVFMDDNTPCHRSQAVIRWLKSKGLKRMEVWPPQSPDLNPIEHVWDILEANLECYKPKNLRELEERIKEEWSKYQLLVCKI